MAWPTVRVPGGAAVETVSLAHLEVVDGMSANASQAAVEACAQAEGALALHPDPPPAPPPTVHTVQPALVRGAPGRPAGPTLGAGVPAVRLALELHWVLQCRRSAGTD